MNRGYGKAQREMHPTKINREVGYLGPHEKIIDVGDKQHMVLQDGGNRPFWMTPKELVATKFIQYDYMLLKYKRRGPAQDVLFFYTPYHLIELQNSNLIISTHLPFIFIFK